MTPPEIIRAIAELDGYDWTGVYCTKNGLSFDPTNPPPDVDYFRNTTELLRILTQANAEIERLKQELDEMEKFAIITNKALGAFKAVAAHMENELSVYLSAILKRCVKCSSEWSEDECQFECLTKSRRCICGWEFSFKGREAYTTLLAGEPVDSANDTNPK